MDQNRCLLDVIDNPQLLQSFLESEATAAEAPSSNNINDSHGNTNNNNITSISINNDDNTSIHETRTTYSQFSTNPISTRECSSPTVDSTTASTSSTQIQLFVRSGENFAEAGQAPNQDKHDGRDAIDKPTDVTDSDQTIDPVVSVLDSIITDTVAETSPSTAHDYDARDDKSPALQDITFIPESSVSSNNVNYPPINHPCSYASAYDESSHPPKAQSNPFDFEHEDTPALREPDNLASSTNNHQATDVLSQNISTDNYLNINDPNNNSTSSSDNGSNDLLVDEYYPQQNVAGRDDAQQQQKQEHLHIQQDPKCDPHGEMGPNHAVIQHTITQEPFGTAAPSINPPDINASLTTHTENDAILTKTLTPTINPQEKPSEQIEYQNTSESNSLNPPVQETFHKDEHHQQIQDIQQSQPQQPHDQSQASLKAQPPQVEPPQANITSNTQSTEIKIEQKTEINTQQIAVKPIQNAPKPPEPTPKPKRTNYRAKKNKTTPVTSSSTVNTQSPNTSKPIQSNQFLTTPPPQQQIIFQSNNGMRQPVMMSSSPMSGQVLTGVPQPQRVIQIQTPNGPMYFAIAPGPAANLGHNNNSMMNQNQQQQQQHQQHQPHQQQQQPQQVGMQSQYPSQQICFQPNSNVLVGRPHLTPMMQSQQFRSQQSSPQPQQQLPQRPVGIRQTMINSSAPTMMVGGQQMIQPAQQRQMVPGQAVSIANQSNPQQPPRQHIVIPSSQPMMMPRMPNQIVFNRPMSGGQIVPGQQQFIQIMTANGPMLLALPTQQAQPINNTMIDYNNQLQAGQQPVAHSVHLQQQPQLQTKPSDTSDGPYSAPSKQSNAKNASNSKSGLDLADLLLDCGILPEDKSSSQSMGSLKSSQSPSLSQISSPMPNMSQNDNSMPNSSNPSPYPDQSQPQPMTGYATQPALQQQPVRITIGPDGQMMMQPAIYGAVRPVLASSVGQTSQISTMAPSNVLSPGTNIMTLTAPSSSPKIAISETASNDSSKKTTKGKTAAVKRSRSKKSDVDKFPQLKTPKIAQQQQNQQLQNHQQQYPTVAVVPMTVLAASSDQKPSMAQLASGQQIPLAKFVTPVHQSTINPSQPAIVQNSASTIVQNQSHVVNSIKLNTQSMMNAGDGISASVIHHQQSSQQDSTFVSTATPTSANSSSASQLSSSGNVQPNLLKCDLKIGTVESNPHISSSLTPTSSLTVDTLKIEQNGLKPIAGPIQTSQSVKGLVQNIGGVTTIVLRPATACIQQQQQQNQIEAKKARELQQQQQLARQKELRAQNILNQLNSDQNAALNPKTKDAFVSVEDACKRLLRYHVYDTEPIHQSKIKKGRFSPFDIQVL